MTKHRLPVPVYRIALLQAYLFEIFASNKKCEENFKYTEWYLTQNFSEEEIEKMLKFFNESELKCDCDIITKIDLRELSDDLIKFHN